MVWKRARRPFAGGAGSRRRAPGFECHGSRPAFRGPRNMETDGIMRKEDDRSATRRFQGVGRSGAQGKGVAGRIRPHWIRPATPFWFPWCAGRGSRGVPPPGVEPSAVTKEKTKTVPVGAWARPGRKGSGRARAVRRDHGERSAARPGVRFVGSLLRALGVGRGLRPAAAGDGHEGRASAEHDDRGQRDQRDARAVWARVLR